jgi:hypothetical protein
MVVPQPLDPLGQPALRRLAVAELLVRHGQQESVEQLPAAEPDDAGRMVCDHFSLQLWCLAGPERWPVCIFFADGAKP